MNQSFEITDADASLIFDSRGSETIEVELWSEKTSARVAAPSGKSRGSNEAVPFPPRGVVEAVELFERELKRRLVGFDPVDQRGLDMVLKEVDGTSNFSRIGGNLSYAVSAAAALLAAKLTDTPLWKYISNLSGIKPSFPLPLGNVLGGGAHAAEGAPDIQEFLVFPAKPSTAEDAFRTNIEVHRRLGRVLIQSVGGYGGGKSDEGGYAPPIEDKTALKYVAEAARGLDVGLGLDVAASTLYNPQTKTYVYRNRGVQRTTREQFNFIQELVESYKLSYVEDPFEETDFESYSELCRAFPSLLVCGDDLVVTRKELVRKAAERRSVRAVILKPNQVGCITDTVEAAVEAERHGIVRVVSHRSGETCDAFLSHLAVGLGGRFIKAGVVGGERVAKANEILRIWRKHRSELAIKEVASA
ncbi:MAG: hypothetical protein NZ570_00315 [Candidatus Caldarchaeum sp.]|nr:hypothetical protein [Candidatus Caldarchaeum sp.]MDW8360003.1 enolase C-terminal domain-like protein [Candidatus Caldarchaeum sp.]